MKSVLIALTALAALVGCSGSSDEVGTAITEKPANFRGISGSSDSPGVPSPGAAAHRSGTAPPAGM
ncbi:hypothetical protein EON82_09660 [bacterium]|nr:MAG: hypothetical protein EON82_09660 [bacterium]